MPLPLAAMIPGVLKGGLGLLQLIKGGKMKPQRPDYTIPGEITEEEKLARQLAGGRMFGIQQAEERVRQQGAGAELGLRRGSTSSSQYLAGLAAIQANTNAAERGLLEAEAGDKYRRLANLSRSLNVSAQYKDKEFELNKLQSYLDKARTKAALTQSGLLNLFGGATDVAGGITSSQRNAEMMKYLMGRGNISPQLFSILNNAALK